MSYLTEIAIDEVWCSPKQDKQVMVRLDRLSKLSGEYNYFNYFGRITPLPKNGIFYHVFNIGYVPPEHLNIIGTVYDWNADYWVPITDAINKQNVLIEVYDNKGYHIPNSDVTYCITEEGGIIIAIEESSTYLSTYKGDIFIRFYSNAFFDTSRFKMTNGDVTKDGLYSESVDIVDTFDIINLDSTYRKYLQATGYCFLFINGLYKENADIRTVNIGDSVTMLYDESVKKIVEFKLSDILTFNSSLDKKWKYLLHYQGDDMGTIDYIDDIDIYVCFPSSNNTKSGLYYNRNLASSHRMVTHRDYSILEDNIRYLIDETTKINNGIPFPISDITIKVFIRDGGYLRNLIFDNNRIFELYKINDYALYAGSAISDSDFEDRLYRTMVGTNSNIDVWKASELEKCGYIRMMGAEQGAIDNPLVVDCYGYNSLSMKLGHTPIKEDTKNSGVFILPTACKNECTVYEYDILGRLIKVSNSVNAEKFYSSDPNTRMIESIIGKGSHNPSEFLVNSVKVPIANGNRVYGSVDDISLSKGEWREISSSEMNDDGTYFSTDSVKSGCKYFLVRDEFKFLGYQKEVTFDRGVFKFNITEIQTRNGAQVEIPLEVSFGELDIFVNDGNSLIKDIDYRLENNTVIIYSCDFLKQPYDTATQMVTVRFTGFCDSDLKLTDNCDIGFIEHGVLSNNNRFDLRDDRVIRIVVNGEVLTRDDVLFSESHTGVSILNAINGQPYSIRDVIVPMEKFTGFDTYELRNKSRIIDKQISDYLTTIIPQPVRNAISVMPKQYSVYSPFFNRIISSVLSGIIDASEQNNDTKVLSVCERYKDLLPFDPILRDSLNVDKRFLVIHPHPGINPIQVTLPQYKFFKTVAKLYFNNIIKVSQYFTVNGA